MWSIFLYQIMLFFGVVIIYSLIKYEYLQASIMAWGMMIISLVFFSYIYYLLLSTKDEEINDRKRIVQSSVIAIPCIVAMLYIIVKTYIVFL
ncbi:hypothetical protein BVH56_00905 [Abyssicoccus albus]|nr:hypothetical protein BVH56_00905 [Abyssicoccus albus]